MSDQLLTVRQFAALHHVAPTTVYRWISLKQISCVEIYHISGRKHYMIDAISPRPEKKTNNPVWLNDDVIMDQNREDLPWHEDQIDIDELLDELL